MNTPETQIRRGALADAEPVYRVFVETTADLERRFGTPDAKNIWLDAAFVADYWRERQTLFEHLARTADQYWVAERRGEIVGFARATIHDRVRELLEFFVLPAHQGQGIGGELLRRAFPSNGTRHRVIIATTEIHALARYLKAGVYPRFPIYYLSRKPERVAVETDLEFVRAAGSPETLAALRAVDLEVLGMERDADHEFLLSDRPAELYLRNGQVLGYGYFGKGTGPIALLEPSDFPAVLARAETAAAEAGEAEFAMNLPLINKHAVDYLLARDFRIDPFTVFFMSDAPFGKFEQYIFTSPPFFM